LDNRRRHGIMTLGLAALAVALAAVAAFHHSVVLGAVYMLLSALAVPVVLLSYCAKCPDSDQCGHVLPGRAVSVLGGKRKGAYSKSDLALTAAALAVVFMLPQAWLWKRPADGVVFWGVMAAAAFDIRLMICRDCGNRHCPGNRLHEKNGKRDERKKQGT
jgi:hypothetical protein